MEHNLIAIHAFACKYLNLYSDSETTIEEVTSDFEEECRELGFVQSNTAYIPCMLGNHIYKRWNDIMHSSKDLLSNSNREWFQDAFQQLITVTEGALVLKKPLHKFKLTSNIFAYGPMPSDGMEVQQKLSVSDNGSIWLTRYYFSWKDNDTHCKSKEKIPADKKTIQRILEAIRQAMEEYQYDPVLDGGYWNISVTNTDNKSVSLEGSVFSESFPGLSGYIREQLHRNDLFLFDGNPDRIEKIEITYNRHTEIELPRSNNSHAVWNYQEEMTLDRSKETIDYYRKIADKCDIHTTYHVEEGVSSFLDNIGTDVFSDIKGNPADVYTDPCHTSAYRILVTTRNTGTREITGTFDKNGLPVDYPVFIKDLYDFLSFYGIGETFDKNLYGKVRRRIHDLIFCNVVFEEGGREYCYLSDEDYDPGDLVIVPAGEDNHDAVVKVVSVEYHPVTKAPYPLDKIKHIKRRYDEEMDERLLS